MALDRPVSGRIFFEQLIRDNLDIGRPDKVNIVFGRTIRQRGKYRTPGTFRTQVITTGTCPYLYYLYYEKTHDGQYLKEGRALRTETTINQPRDLGIGKELTNLAAMAKAGYTASRRLATPNASATTPPPGPPPWKPTNPVISTTCTRVPGMRFPDPRLQALLAACCALALRAAGFTSRDLRHLLAPQLGKDPGDMSGGQISYDLRGLRAHQIIERIPHSRTYQVTADGLSTALFFTRPTRRVPTAASSRRRTSGLAGRATEPGTVGSQPQDARRIEVSLSLALSGILVFG
jgi:hypothetical protein